MNEWMSDSEWAAFLCGVVVTCIAIMLGVAGASLTEDKAPSPTVKVGNDVYLTTVDLPEGRLLITNKPAILVPRMEIEKENK